MPVDSGPDIHVAPKTLMFGSVPVGHSTNLTVTVSNQAGGTLEIGDIALANPLDPPFTIVSDSCSNTGLMNSQSCTIEVAFSPTDSGSFMDNFDIPSNDTGETPVTVYVSSSDFKSSGGSQDIEVTPSNLDYGEVGAGSTRQMEINVSNQGTETLVIGNIGVADPLSLPFAVVTDNCSGASLDHGEICSVMVSFSPASDKASSDSFDIPSNDPDEPSVIVQVRGEGKGGVGPVSIPALNQWGFTILMGLLAIAAIMVIIIRRFVHDKKLPL